MSRRGENIWHRKDGRWEARYVKSRNNGRAVYGYVYAKTYKEAKELQLSKIKEIGRQETLKNSKITMSEVFDLYLNHKKHTVKESTYAKYKRDIQNHLNPYWGYIPLNEVDGIKIEDFTTHLVNKDNFYTRKKLSVKTVKDIVILLKSVIAYANQRELSDISLAYISSPKSDTPHIRTLSYNDQKILENYLYQSPAPDKLGILLTLYTGLRIGELCALKWKNIDIQNRILHIDSTMQRIKDDLAEHSTKIILDSPKSNASIREIPIFGELFNRLKNYADCSEDCYFLTGSTEYIEPRILYRKYQACLRACGLPHYTFHSLRHTFATRAIECGCDPKSLSEILGHSNVKITLDRYVHPDMERKKNQIQLLSKIAQF